MCIDCVRVSYIQEYDVLAPDWEITKKILIATDEPETGELIIFDGIVPVTKECIANGYKKNIWTEKLNRLT